MDKDETPIGQNYNIDSLIDEVISDNQSNEQFESNRVKSENEIARNELFSEPLKIDMEQIDINLGLKPKKTSKKKEESSTAVKEQQSIDLDSASYNIYKMEEKASENNYKKVLSKLVKNNDIKTESFKVKPTEETEALTEENEYIDENAIKADVAENSLVDSSVSVRLYSPKTAVDDLYGLTFINKVKFLTLACITFFSLIEVGAIFLYLTLNFTANNVFFLIATLIGIIPFGVGLFIYTSNPSKKARSKFSYGAYFLNSLIVFVLAAVLILVFGLLTSIPFGDIQQLLPKIVLPTLFALNCVLGVGIFALIVKSGAFAVKE